VKVNSGNDAQACAMGGDLAGTTGTATATSATSLTNSGASFGTYTGHVVVAGTVYGVIVSNTGTVLTIDQWYNPGSPGGSAGSTPGSTSSYVVLPGQAPYWYIAITTDSTAPSASDTTLPSEITTAAGGLKRKLATYAHTTGVNSFSLATTFTANGSDTLPAVIAKAGIFNSVVPATGRMQFETLVSPTATLSASGDQLTLTDTVTT
jgi:hypothetical protein